MARQLIAGSIAIGLLVGCHGERTPEPPSTPQNVLLYIADTLRADSLSFYGGSVVETPHLDSLARDGTVFERAYATSSWTRASVGSMLTGLYPDVHGAETRNDVLGEHLVLLPEIFSQHGYRTAAIVTNPNVGARYGFDQGFDEFIELFGRRVRKMVDQQTANQAQAAAVDFVGSDEVTERAIAWIEADSAPFFLFILSIDPHWPYEPPARFDRYRGSYSGRIDEDRDAIFRARLSGAERQRIRSLYYGEIAFNDDSLGRLLDHLRAAGSYEDTTIVFASDHGEEFWDHGKTMHGRTLYEEAIRVPLVIRSRGRRASRTRMREPVDLTDIAATLLALAGFPLPYELDGRSLFARSSAPAKLAYSTLELDQRSFDSIIDPPWKLIRNRTDETLQLFDLAADEAESWNVWGKEPGRAKALREALLEQTSRSARRRAQLQRNESPRTVPDSLLPEAEVMQLKALGYMRDEATSP